MATLASRFDATTTDAHPVCCGEFWYVIGRGGGYALTETLDPRPVSYRFRQEAQAHADRLNA